MSRLVSITDEDIERVINKMKQDGVFDEINKIRKEYKVYLLKKIMYLLFLFLLVLIITFWLVFHYLTSNISDKSSLIIMVIITLFFIFPYLYLIVLELLPFFKASPKAKANEIKKNFLKDYVKILNKNLSYDPSGKCFPMPYHWFYSGSGFMHYYEGIDKEEDSMKFSQDSFNLYGEEIQTYKTIRDENLNSRIVTVDHAYIFYVQILKHRFPIKRRVTIIPDVADSGKKEMDAYLNNISLAIYFGLAGGLGLSIFISPFLEELFNIPFEISFTAITLTVIFLFVFGGIYSTDKKINKNRVKLENIEFEKIFDVKSKNQIEARRILTPKMMEKLVELVKKSGMSGRAFTFTRNKIYAKFDVKWGILEINLLKKPEDQIRIFFKQIKLILDFVNYLNIEYFSESEFSKER